MSVLVNDRESKDFRLFGSSKTGKHNTQTGMLSVKRGARIVDTGRRAQKKKKNEVGIKVLS